MSVIVSWDGNKYTVERDHKPIDYQEWYGDFKPNPKRPVTEATGWSLHVVYHGYAVSR